MNTKSKRRKNIRARKMWSVECTSGFHVYEIKTDAKEDALGERLYFRGNPDARQVPVAVLDISDKDALIEQVAVALLEVQRRIRAGTDAADIAKERARAVLRSLGIIT